jgi:hypothetical protein
MRIALAGMLLLPVSVRIDGRDGTLYATEILDA